MKKNNNGRKPKTKEIKLSYIFIVLGLASTVDTMTIAILLYFLTTNEIK